MSSKVDWKFYFHRKNKTLQGFLSGITSLEVAREKFVSRGLSLPPEDLILECLKETVLKKELASKPPEPKKTVPRRKQTTKQKSKKSTSNPEEKEAPKDAKYFRKVFPKKKK